MPRAVRCLSTVVPRSELPPCDRRWPKRDDHVADLEPFIFTEEDDDYPDPVLDPSMPIRDYETVMNTSRFELTFDKNLCYWEECIYLDSSKFLGAPKMHLNAEHKVKGEIYADDLGLEPIALARLAYMAGLRYNPGKQILKITCDYFMSRIENKRWILYTIEQLRRAAMQPDEEFDIGYHREMRMKERETLRKQWPQLQQKKQQQEQQQNASSSS